MATLKDVARDVGVSVSAVSMAMRNHASIGQETKERIRDSAIRLGYRSRKRTGGSLAFVLFDRHFDAGYARFFQSIGKLAVDHDQQPSYFALESRDFLRGHMPAALQRHDVDGIIVSGLLNEAIYQKISELGLPTVVLGNYQLGTKPWASCEVDLASGMRLALEQFAQHQREPVALIASSSAKGEYGLQMRQGFQNAAASLGVKVAGIIEQRELLRKGPEVLQDALVRLLQGPNAPTGIIAENINQWFFDACAALKLEIPRDLSLIALGRPPLQSRLILTCLESNLEEMGQGAFHKLAWLIQHPDSPLTRESFSMQLLPGDSLAPTP